MKPTWTAFTGIRPKTDPRLLPDGSAQVAVNVDTEHGGVRPLAGNTEVMALAKTNVQTIYRFGQALESDTQYWFCWTMDVDVVKGPINNDTDERTYWTGDGAPKYTTTAWGTAGTDLPSASRPLGVAPPQTAPLVAASGTPPDGAGSETREYIYTFTTDTGDISSPSPPAQVTIVVGQEVKVSGLETTSINGAVVASKQIYRAQRGTYLLVGSIDGSQQVFVDNVPSDALGEACPSIDWVMPSPTLYGLTLGQNGMMAALDGYTVAFCEPFHPYAWPIGYQQALTYPAVAIGQAGGSFIVLTTGDAFRLTGAHPSQMTVVPTHFFQPCLAKRSVVSTGSGDVIWASPEGLVSLGASGGLILTGESFTADQWMALKPNTMVGAWHRDWYIGTYDPGTGRVGFMFNPVTKEWIDLPGLSATAMYRDTVGDSLFMCIDDKVCKFRDGDPLPFQWRSGEVVAPLSDLVAGRVTGDYPVTFKYYKDGALVYTREVDSDEPFKLPAGLARTFSVQVEGTNPVLGIVLSSTEKDI